MRLRHATLKDIDLLKYWDTKPHVIAAGGEEDWFDWEKELSRAAKWQKFLIAEINTRPIGIMQIIDPALEHTHYWGDVAQNLQAIDIWIGEEADLGLGYGTQMMELAFQLCFTDPTIKAILIDPLATNSAACRFYERLGFKQLETRKFGSDNCIIYQLTRSDWLERNPPQ